MDQDQDGIGEEGKDEDLAGEPLEGSGVEDEAVPDLPEIPGVSYRCPPAPADEDGADGA